MKKTVFKGTINGKNFDSVQAYNEEMTRVLAAGESIIANSSTTSIDEEEENDIDYTPGFSNKNEYYIDKYVTGDADKDVNLYYEAKNYLENSFDIIKNDLNNFDEEELDDYAKQLSEIIDFINDDESTNTDSLKIVNDEISRLEQNLNNAKKHRDIYINAVQIISLFKEQYNEFLHRVKDKQDNEIQFESCDCDCGCDCKCDEKCCEKCEKKSEIDFKDISNSITNLFKEIFG